MLLRWLHAVHLNVPSRREAHPPVPPRPIQMKRKFFHKASWHPPSSWGICKPLASFCQGRCPLFPGSCVPRAQHPYPLYSPCPPGYSAVGRFTVPTSSRKPSLTALTPSQSGLSHGCLPTVCRASCPYFCQGTCHTVSSVTRLSFPLTTGCVPDTCELLPS